MTRREIEIKKDNYRDYVVEAMRFYALCGRPNETELRKIKAQLSDKDGRYRDLQAVYNMLYRLGREEYGPDGVSCVEKVYFAHPERRILRNEITERITIVADELCIYESKVYNALRRARVLVAQELQLRTDEDYLFIRGIIKRYDK